MKRLLFILIPSILLALLIFLIVQYILRVKNEKGALQVTSSPESKIYLNDQYLGQTPLCKCEANDVLPTGDYTIRLVPLDKSLSEFQEKITISQAVLTVVDRKFAKDSLSEGSIISLSPLSDKKKMELLVVSFPQDATVWLDNSSIGNTPLLTQDLTESDHVLKVRKNGYKEKTVRIRTPKGFKLTVAVYLATSLDASDDTNVSVTPTSAPPTIPTLTTTPAQATILIQDTPTGFLRVRDNYTSDAKEIERVYPGETYQLLDEQSGWFEIKLNDGRGGWISQDYAKKQE